MQKYFSPRLTAVKLQDPVFAPRVATAVKTTIHANIKQAVETGRVAAFDLKWKEGMPDKPHVYWDSDVAKILEGMAYVLALAPDSALEKVYDEWVDKICASQQPDGYLNSYFTTVAPEKRFHRLACDHELYCAGHLLEAAIAGFEYLGKRKFLDTMCRYMDYLCSVFGKSPGKRRGWPGHEEIELALAKLYRLTNKERYLELLRYFINDRGTEPNVFAEEGFSEILVNLQAAVPVREQQSASGHAVRQMYLCSGMAELGAIDGDDTLLESCERIFDSIVNKKMYLTGGIGSSFEGEKFTEDYDLPNGSTMYAESCANMALAFFALRMYNITGKMKFLDTAELVLYNSALSGISLSGDHFFYNNCLEMDDNQVLYNAAQRTRTPWFFCSCCPTSFARVLPQLSSFIYSVSSESRTVTLNIPAANHAELPLGDDTVILDVKGAYPADGLSTIVIGSSLPFTLSLRIPAWCKNCTVKLNGELQQTTSFTRKWQKGDTVELFLDMQARWIYSNPKVTTNGSRVAIKRGPVVYALEEIDQCFPVRELLLRTDAPLELVPLPNSLGTGLPAIKGKALHETFSSEELYSEEAPVFSDCTFLAIPYALWQNRGDSNMTVWPRRKA